MENIQLAQNIARSVMFDLVDRIKPGITEREIKELAEELEFHYGSEVSWYHGIGALVLIGENSIKSSAGRDYRVSDLAVKENDIITVDLAPTKNAGWGDYARTIYVKDGVPSLRPFGEYEKLHNLHRAMHDALVEVATPDFTFNDVWQFADKYIKENGLVNLDFGNNYGHSINTEQADRIYILEGNDVKITSVCDSFTFEPHLSLPDGKFGVKREDIYYFNKEGKLEKI